MYDSFSSDYDRFVNWPSRLAYELPLIEQQLGRLADTGAAHPLRVLDAACGTGMHAIALAQRGFQAAGADLSPGMVARARENAAAAGLDIPFETAGFGGLAQTFRASPLYPFDTLLCLGNSLPHLLAPQEVAGALVDFAACLRPGGLLLVQNRNFDAVMAGRERWMEPQSYHEAGAEWIFLRFYDYRPDGLIDFNILTLKREAGGDWKQSVTTTRLRPLLYKELAEALAQAGFGEIEYFGNMTGAPFDPQTSPNLILAARI